MEVSISIDKQTVTMIVTMRRDKTHRGGITNYFGGATIKNLVINGNMIRNGTENDYDGRDEQAAPVGYTDEQIARALAKINGKGRAIDSKMKWAGAHWLLRWECNFPARAKDFCERVAELPLPEDLEFKCDYRNIREISTLSFMNEDPRQLEQVRYSKNDEQVFFLMKEVVTALAQELHEA